MDGDPVGWPSIRFMMMTLSYLDIGTDEKLEKTTNYWKILKIPGVTILFFHCCIACISVTFLEPALGPFMLESVSKEFFQTNGIFYVRLIHAPGRIIFGILFIRYSFCIYFKYNSTPSTIGLTYGAWSLVYALFCPVFGKLADKVNCQIIIYYNFMISYSN